MSRFSEISAERLREAMERKNITASELVKRSGVSKSNISGYINGKFTPTNLNAKKLADALNVKPEWLMGLMPYDIDTTSKYLAEISQGKHPQVTDIIGITQGLDEYFLNKLLAYARELEAIARRLEQSSAFDDAEYEFESHESEQQEFEF